MSCCQRPKLFLCQAVNMLISAGGSTGIDSRLESASCGHSRNCRFFWHFHVGFRFQPVGAVCSLTVMKSKNSNVGQPATPPQTASIWMFSIFLPSLTTRTTCFLTRTKTMMKSSSNVLKVKRKKNNEEVLLWLWQQYFGLFNIFLLKREMLVWNSGAISSWNRD